MNAAAQPSWSERLAPLVRGFHRYATWLVGISWLRFFLLSLLLMIVAAVLQSMPPFSWTMREFVMENRAPPATPTEDGSRQEDSGRSKPVIRIEKSGTDADGKTVDIVIDRNGVRVHARPRAPASAASSADTAASAASAPSKAASGLPREVRVEVGRDGQGANQSSIRVVLPEGEDGLDHAAIREAIEEVRSAVREALREPTTETIKGPGGRSSGSTYRVSYVQTDALTDLALLWILASIIIKLAYKGQLQARAQAAQATEMAEAESLKRQLAEARMATMQAQVEPHFLFNTLGSIEHLIETDPTRASRMQRALIDLLRATMPTLRDGGSAANRTLGHEQAVIEPYLAILRIRMEDRLEPTVQIPDGLRSAECPPMVLQMLVENAIKHGLEPKPEGGQLRVEAGIVDGKLMLTVEDSGVGLPKGWDPAAAPQGHTGLKNIRERLSLRYGEAAQLLVAPREGGGTRVTIRLPYRVVDGAADDLALNPSKGAST